MEREIKKEALANRAFSFLQACANPMVNGLCFFCKGTWEPLTKDDVGPKAMLIPDTDIRAWGFSHEPGCLWQEIQDYAR